MRVKLAGRPKKGNQALNSAQIVDAAWTLVNAHGVDALSTRALAQELGVKSPALYWHISNKAELLGLMVAEMLTRSLVHRLNGEDWDTWLIRFARGERQTLLAYRDSARIFAIAPMADAVSADFLPVLIVPLQEAGFSEQQAYSAIGGLASLVLGWVAYEQSDNVSRFMSAMIDVEAGFELALHAYMSGLRGILGPALQAA